MKSFRMFAFIIAMIFMFSISQASALDFGGLLGGGEKKKEGNFDIEKTSIRMREALYVATELTLKAMIEMQRAVGNKEEVVKLEQLHKKLTSAKEKKDDASFQQTFTEIQSESAKQKTSELLAKKEAKSATAKKHIGRAFLNTGVAVFLDKKAIDYGKLLVNKLPGEIRANPMQATKLNATLDLAQFTVKNVPDQLSNITGTFSELGKYASTHGMSAPSDAEIKKSSKQAAPSVPTEEEVS